MEAQPVLLLAFIPRLKLLVLVVCAQIGRQVHDLLVDLWLWARNVVPLGLIVNGLLLNGREEVVQGDQHQHHQFANDLCLLELHVKVLLSEVRHMIVAQAE